MGRKYKVAKDNKTTIRHKVKVPDKTYDNIVRKKSERQRNQFPAKYPFWARLKMDKDRTVLVIDDEVIIDKKKRNMASQNKKQRRVLGFVHREATSKANKRFEEIKPNPDKDKTGTMYLKPPRKKPIGLFKPHNKKLKLPEDLRKRYSKNNRKKFK